MTNFKEINYGDQDAYKDALLKSCFIDQGLISQILTKQINYVIGPKGSGKSAVAAHLLDLESNDKFIRLFDVEKFYKIKRLLQPLLNESTSELGELAWKVVLVDELLQSLGADHSLFLKPEWQDIERIYKTSFGTLNSNTTKKERKFEIGLPKAFGPLLESGKISYSTSSENKATSLYSIENACDNLLKSISTLHISNKHIILVDKIDDKYDNTQWFLELIKGLIIQVDKFSSINRQISVVAFLRDDINRRIYFSNFNKLNKQTYRIEWGRHVEDAKRNLGLLIKKRIEGILGKKRPETESPWSALYNLYFSHLPSHPHESSADYLIERTLWRPRDIIEYCNAIHKQMTTNGMMNTTDRAKLTQAIRTAEYNYSKYFLQELTDSCCVEINSIAPFETFKNILMGLRLRCFDRDGWCNACTKKEINETDAIKALSILYEHGVIGLYDEINDETWWYHRTGSGAFNDNFKFNIHFGLYKIFQLY